MLTGSGDGREFASWVSLDASRHMEWRATSAWETSDAPLENKETTLTHHTSLKVRTANLQSSHVASLCW